MRSQPQTKCNVGRAMLISLGTYGVCLSNPDTPGEDRLVMKIVGVDCVLSKVIRKAESERVAKHSNSPLLRYDVVSRNPHP